MIPSFSVNYPANCRNVNAVFSSKFPSQFCLSAPNIPDVKYREFRHVKKFLSAFFNHVSTVVFIGSQKKMLRINTGWIIAMMKHLHAVWNYPIVDKPACSVGTNHINSLAGKDSAITFFAFEARPIPAPALGCEGNLGPKSAFKRFVQLVFIGNCHTDKSNLSLTNCKSNVALIL